MKIFNNIVFPVSIFSAALAPVSILASCSCTNDFEELNLDEQKQYIKDRTFSIMAKSADSYCFGTGWIISDATKLDTNDYSYYLATNSHVKHSFETNSMGSVSYYYGDDSLKTSKKFIDAKSEYQLFNKFEFEKDENFIYINQTWSEYFTPSIDLSVIKVNFGTPAGTIKTKLDNLNKLSKSGKPINTFVADSETIRTKNKIVGGYPKMQESSKSFGGCWEAHSFAGNLMTYYQKNYKYDKTNMGHSIGYPYYDQTGKVIEDGSEDFYYWDVSPQYMFSSAISNTFMPGGASGSMLLTQDNEICGIYWGGWEGKNGSFYPSFSLFNTQEKNFLEKYI